MFLLVLKETKLTNSVIVCSFLFEPGHSSRFLNPLPWIHHEQQNRHQFQDRNLRGYFSTKKKPIIVSKEIIITYMFILLLPGTNHLLPPACENWPVVENLPKIHMQNDLVKLANASSSRRVIPCHSPTRWKITPFFSTRWLSGSVLLSLGGYLRLFFRAWWYRYRYLNIMTSDGSPIIRSPLKRMVLGSCSVPLHRGRCFCDYSYPGYKIY